MKIISKDKCELECDCGFNIHLGCDANEYKRFIGLLLNENLISVFQYDELRNFYGK